MQIVDHFRPETEFYIGERCYITELHNTGLDPGCSVARARLEPGVTTKLHRVQDTIERYVIIEGEGEVEIDGGAPQAVCPMDIVNIAAGAVQRITNTGARDLIFLCICTPRFVAQNYVDCDAPP